MNYCHKEPAYYPAINYPQTIPHSSTQYKFNHQGSLFLVTLLEFTPIQYPLRDELTRQPIAWIESLDLHITLTPDQQRSTHGNQAAYWLGCSAVQLLNNLMSNLSIKLPLLFNAPWRKELLVAIPFTKAMGEYGAAIAERSVDGAQRAEINNMPMHNNDMSTYNMLQYQTRADRVAARSINIQ
ncbi:hypothetical protein MJO28_012624 [Puccinia striiformis f. sp. tritici]|uniref:Uncharacterized protein n=1 Tax=Puccinia striiformis f. sp. tritici TaxID=168172 RepID=A0ACC0E0W8_9BASI|nr:hypothetical protein MJO28_012624 [Puccinia striiformis f. sp. tritici]